MHYDIQAAYFRVPSCKLSLSGGARSFRGLGALSKAVRVSLRLLLLRVVSLSAFRSPSSLLRNTALSVIQQSCNNNISSSIFIHV